MGVQPALRMEAQDAGELVCFRGRSGFASDAGGQLCAVRSILAARRPPAQSEAGRHQTRTPKPPTPCATGVPFAKQPQRAHLHLSSMRRSPSCTNARMASLRHVSSLPPMPRLTTPSTTPSGKRYASSPNLFGGGRGTPGERAARPLHCMPTIAPGGQRSRRPGPQHQLKPNSQVSRPHLVPSSSGKRWQ